MYLLISKNKHFVFGGHNYNGSIVLIIADDTDEGMTF